MDYNKLEEFEKQKTKVMNYIMYKKRTEKEEVCHARPDFGKGSVGKCLYFGKKWAGKTDGGTVCD